MGNRKTGQLRGFGVCDERWSSDRLKPNGAAYLAGTDSNVTQAGPRPGSAIAADPRSHLRPQVSGGQSEDLDVYVSRAGHPGLGDSSAAVAWKKTAEAATDWRAWNAPNWLRGFQIRKYDSTNTWQGHAIATIPSSGEVIAVAYNGLAVGFVCELYDPLTDTWATKATPTPYIQGPFALAVLPGTERILLLACDSSLGAAADRLGPRVWYSDDKAATWALYSASPFSDDILTTAMYAASMAVVGDELILVVQPVVGTAMRHYASRDLGSTFDRVGTTRAGYDVRVCATPSGQAVVSYRDSADSNKGKILRLGHAYDPMAAASLVPVEVYGVALEAFVAVADDDGTLYAIATTTTPTHSASLSTDGGATWTAYTTTFADWQDNAIHFWDYVGACSSGRVVLWHRWDSLGGLYAEKSLAASTLGGWSNVTQPTNAGSIAQSQLARLRMGWDHGWFPAGLPDTPGVWAVNGTAADRSIVAGELEIDSAIASNCYFDQLVSASTAELLALFEVRVDSGGNTANNEIAIGLEVKQAWVNIRLSTTGFAAYDVVGAAAVGTAATVDLTSDMQIMIWVDGQVGAGELLTWYRRPGVDVWTAGPSGAVALGAGTSTTATWGHVTAAIANNVSYWRLLMFSNSSYLDPNQASGLASVMGKPLGSSSYPLPGAGSSTEGARLSLVSGPARVADTYAIPAEHDFGIRELYATGSPSSARPWRSTSTAAQHITQDLTERTRLGDSWSIVLYVGGCNFRQVQLGGYNGTTWSTLGTLDLATGFTGLGYDLLGDVVRPSAGTSAAGRWLQGMELAGWRAILPSGKSRRIVRSSGGSWSTASTAKPEVIIEGVDGTEAASGVLDLVAPEGVMVVHLPAAAASMYSHLRLVIAGAQATPPDEAYYQIGTCLVAGLLCTGKGWGDGWSWSLNPNTRETVTPYGTRTITEEGPPVQALTVAWQDGQRMAGLRGAAGDADYVGPSSGAPIAADQDVWGQLSGLLRSSKSGQRPVVAIGAVPDASGVTITDRTLFTFGHVTEGRVSVQSVTGTENVDEFVRVESITITGCP